MSLGRRPTKSETSKKAWHRPMDWPAEEDKTKNLCSRHESMNLSRGLFAAWPINKELPLDTPFGILRTVRERATFCVLCRLISQAAEDVVDADRADIIGCWVRDGRLEGKETTSLRLRVTSPPLVDGYNTYQVCDIVPYDPDGMISDLFTGRAMNKQQIDFTLACSWVRKCEEWHGGACRQKEAWTTTAIGVPFIRLLDLKQNCVVEMAAPPSYVCLSYVWGSAPVFKTTKANLAQMKLVKSLNRAGNEIPRSIRDAIRVTKTLGERYLWVDSMCIVQDDDVDKGQQISMMGEIYKRASLTLVIAGGDHANCGISGMSKGGRNIKQNVAHLSNDLSLVQLLADGNRAVNKAAWNTRGWTYQERILSLRCLFFTDDTVYFQCQKAAWSEDFKAEHPAMTVCAPMLNIRLSLDGNPAKVIPRDEYNLVTHRRPYFYEYCRLVKNYTMRKMSYTSDRIPGFQAVLSTFEQVYGLSLMQGLPEEMIYESLLWHSTTGRVKRVEAYPSWSWAGWTGGVEYPDLQDFNGLPVLSERWRRTRPISEMMIQDLIAQRTRPVRTCDYQGAVLSEGWKAKETEDGDMVYFQIDKPSILHSIPPPVRLAEGDATISPGGLLIRTQIAKFRLTSEARSDRQEDKNKPRFGILPVNPPEAGHRETWIGGIRLSGFWHLKYKGNNPTPFEFIVLSEAYGFGPDEVGPDSAGKVEPYSVVNVMLVKRKEPISAEGPIVVERVGVGRMLKSAWNANVDVMDVLIV